MVRAKFKHAQSGIIGAVLLILIVLVSAMVIMSFVVPFVKNQLQGSDCLDVVQNLWITNNPDYTCYNSTGKYMSLQIHYGDIENLVQGFQVTIASEGSSNSFKVTPDSDDANVKMLNGSSTIIQPTKNGERTYKLINVDILPESINIYPILTAGQGCDVSDTLTNFVECS